MVAGMTLEKLQALTEPSLQLAANWQVLAPPEASGARGVGVLSTSPSLREEVEIAGCESG